MTGLEDEGAAQGLVELQARIKELERVRRLAQLAARPTLLPFYNRSSAHGDGERRISAQAITEALDGLDVQAARTRIPDRVVVQHAAIARVPIVAYRPDHVAASAFERLTDDVLAEAA